jgi:mannose-6-phosphate isomerase-like protein (cupin superfamily)
MPFVDRRTIPEVLMRPGIHGRFLAHKDLGASTVSLLMNRADPGAAVPLHMHQVEETVVMFEGRIWVQLGDERRVIGPNDTVIIPAYMPHAWGTEGTEAARMIRVYAAPIPLPIPPTSKVNHPSSTPDSAYDVPSSAGPRGVMATMRDHLLGAATSA